MGMPGHACSAAAEPATLISVWQDWWWCGAGMGSDEYWAGQWSSQCHQHIHRSQRMGGCGEVVAWQHPSMPCKARLLLLVMAGKTLAPVPCAWREDACGCGPSPTPLPLAIRRVLGIRAAVGAADNNAEHACAAARTITNIIHHAPRLSTHALFKLCTACIRLVAWDLPSEYIISVVSKPACLHLVSLCF